MFRRQKSFAYSPSPLSHSCLSNEASSSTQSLPNYIPNKTASGANERIPVSSTASSASTLSDVFQFGHPLERVDRVGSAELDPSSDDWPASLFDVQPSSADSPTSTTDYINLDALIESITVSPPHVELNYKLMVRTLSRTSEELRILNKLNESNYRDDPWNPVPYLLCTFDKGESDTYACFEHLTPYDQPSFRTVANYIDFFGQVLEGLTFLHEHFIVNINCSKQSSFMVDLSAGSSSSEFSGSSATSAPHSRPSRLTDWHTPHPHPMHSSSYTYPQTTTDSDIGADDNSSFDRTKFPVKYYLADFSNAIQLPQSSPEHSHDRNSPMSSPPYLKDVKDLGLFFNNMIDNIPQLAPKFKSLVSAMVTGEFTADSARRLFEALCHSIEASVFDVLIEPPPRCCSATSPSPNSGSSSSQSSLG